MPRSTGYKHFQKTRDKIQASAIVNRLQDHVYGKVELSASQVNAAKVLLNKVLPDVRQTELTGPEGEALITGITLNVVKSAEAKVE